MIPVLERLIEKKLKMPKKKDTMGIPRSEMPQVKKRFYNELWNFIRSEAGESTKITKEKVRVKDLKAVQGEFSPEKIQRAIDLKRFKAKAIIISRDNYVIDGNHRWLGAKNAGARNIKAFRIDLPAKRALELVKKFPFSEFRSVNEDEMIEFDFQVLERLTEEEMEG